MTLQYTSRGVQFLRQRTEEKLLKEGKCSHVKKRRNVAVDTIIDSISTCSMYLEQEQWLTHRFANVAVPSEG